MRFLKSKGWVVVVLIMGGFLFWVVWGGKFFKNKGGVNGSMPDFNFIDTTGKIESLVLDKELLAEGLKDFPPFVFWRELDGEKVLVYELGFDGEVIDFGLGKGEDWAVGYSWSKEDGGRRMKVFLEPSLISKEEPDFERVENYLYWVVLDSLMRSADVFDQEEYKKCSEIISRIMSDTGVPLEVRW